jgi:phage portal protein BeeE
LRQKSGEPLSAEEMADMAQAFDSHRRNDATCMVNEHTEVIINDATPDKMLLIEAATFQALEMARLANVPPYLVGVSTGAYSYQSSEQARHDLYTFGVKPYADCITQTLSGDNVLPRGTYVKFDSEEYLESMYDENAETEIDIDVPADARRNGA